MTHTNCESIQLAAMALADGEESPVEQEEIETHLGVCDRCRQEIESLHAVNEFWKSQERFRSEIQLWPLINEQLPTTTESAPSFSWRVFFLFGIPLFGYKVLSLILPIAPSFWSRLLPVILAIAVFSYLKTNPFKINCELTVRGELS